MSLDLFSSLLPDSGYYCIGLLSTKGSFKHRWFDSKEKAYNFAMEMDSQGETVYFAQGGYHEATNRKSDNTKAFRSFWLDLDVGAEKPFATQKEGAEALLQFCDTTGLPVPTLINSGTGLYAYWRIDSDIDSEHWLVTARVLKSLCEATDFRADPARTSDRSSVLRPVGATNRKKGERKVRAIAVVPAISFRSFANALVKAAHKFKVKVKAFDAPVTSDLNSEFQIEMSGEKPSALLIAKKCAQIAMIRDTKGNVPEPQWYAAIGLLKSTVEAPEIIHEWSEGHPSYSRRDTDNKIENHKVHASTCAYLHSVNPEGCMGCRYNGKINSPWRLGLPEPEPVPISDKAAPATDMPLPQGFQRTDRGIIYTDGEGATITVFPYDIYPVKLTQDETLNQEILVLRAKDPHSGWFEVQFRSALLHDQKTALMCLADQGIHPYHGKAERNLFMSLLAGYMQQLKDNRRKMILSQQMGWVEESDGKLAFVLGDRLVSARGIEHVGIAKQADAVVKSITVSGDIEPWADATALLDREGLEPWAFTLAALGFGSPLMKFTGYKGSMLSMVGPSGLGKTAMGWFALSIWGNPEKLQMIQRDTQNATVARMSLYNNLPLFIDEITNIKQEVLSDLAYQMTQGRDKHTLTRSRSERSALTWATIGAASSNKSLVDILGGYKSDPSAEINRIFEYEFPHGTEFDGVTTYRTIMKNFGSAGEIYASYLVEHQDEHMEQLMTLQKQIELLADSRPEERFWCVTAACALYGARIANRLGLFKVDVVRLGKWIIKAIEKMRGVRNDIVLDSGAWLGSFLSRHATNMLVCRSMGNGLFSALQEPRGPLYIRKDVDLNMLWISRDLLKKELLAGSLSYARIKQELIGLQGLIKEDRKMVLGKGTGYSGMAEICWEINLNAPGLGEVIAADALRLAKKEEILNAERKLGFV